MPENFMMIILYVSLVAGLGWFLMRWKRKTIASLKAQKSLLDHARLDVIDKLSTVVILILSAVLLLEVTGHSLNTLIAFGGISGLALAFASQEIIASFFGGLMIYLTHPFFIGDWIILPERSIEGHVEEIGWYTTKIRTLDKRPVYVPNSIFSKIIIANRSRMNHRQIKETIGIRYSDVNELRGVIDDMKRMLEENPDIDQQMANSVYFSAFGTYSLDIVFTAYTIETTTSGYNRVKEEILFSIITILDKHRAELALPTTCIQHVTNDKVLDVNMA